MERTGSSHWPRWCGDICETRRHHCPGASLKTAESKNGQQDGGAVAENQPPTENEDTLKKDTNLPDIASNDMDTN